MKKTVTTFLLAIVLLTSVPQAFASELEASRSGDNFKSRRAELREENKEHFENLREERKERLEEKIELRKQQREDGGEESELKSGGIRARLRGADFDYDSETGVVTITTPSGQVHELNHLPDQAIERMKKLLESDFENTELEIETEEDGSTKYKARGTKKKRFLGLFSRNVDTEAVLDDDTGEVTETELPAKSAFGRFLNALSF